jgi:hypothetical protein
VIEVVSNREGGEDAKKLEIYARIGVRYYAIYDPDSFLSDEVLRVYRLEAMEYHKISEPYWFSGVGLGLRLWEGVYEDFDAQWLRWFDDSGTLVATGREGKEMAEAKAASAEQRAESAEQRAESAEQRAERLAEQLRQLGVEPRQG